MNDLRNLGCFGTFFPGTGHKNNKATGLTVKKDSLQKKQQKQKTQKHKNETSPTSLETTNILNETDYTSKTFEHFKKKNFEHPCVVSMEIGSTGSPPLTMATAQESLDALDKFTAEKVFHIKYYHSLITIQPRN